MREELFKEDMRSYIQAFFNISFNNQEWHKKLDKIKRTVHQNHIRARPKFVKSTAGFFKIDQCQSINIDTVVNFYPLSVNDVVNAKMFKTNVE